MSIPAEASTTEQDQSVPSPAMSERRVALIGGLFVAIGPVSMALYTPAMTEIVRAFGTSEGLVKLTLTLYFAGFACAQLVAGPLSDALGRRPVTLAFMAIYCAGSLLALAAPGIEVLLLARFIQGVGASAGVAISRAIVRDLFTGDRSSAIMNLIGIILAIGPATAPTIGGLTLAVAGWRMIFVLMVLIGLSVMLTTIFALRETVVPDHRKLSFRALGRSYADVLRNARFLGAAGVVAGSIGALYAQSTFLPFILMDRVGLTPTQFGLGMLMQSGFFMAGSLAYRRLLRRYSADLLLAPGLCFIAAGSAGTFCLLFWDATFLRVMLPVGLYAVGIAFVMPSMSTAALLPFPRSAGAAAAMMGFLQMGAGLIVGTIGATFGNAQLAMGSLIPAMGLFAILCAAYYRRTEQLDMLRAMHTR
ncbi:multidrug effflux MFS transporter [Amaricoccus macauensis]|uniref:multidrug effflux MFS transporter n=1 Tax=Amaricoccus macauensis TaxID=57001 RepID=UPI003C7D7D5C